MMAEYSLTIPNEAAMINLGKYLASRLIGCVVYLHGELGAGKTTLVRGMLQGLGYTGNVKSPTYTLVEPYEISGVKVFHFDLYRVGDAEELEYMGIRDYFNEQPLILIEWPERGMSILPEADLDIFLSYQKTDYKDSEGELNETSRNLRLVANNSKCDTIVLPTTIGY